MTAPARRRGSVYLAVVTVVAAVTTLTLTGIALRKQIHDAAIAPVDATAAQRMALSAAEIVTHQAWSDMDQFRTVAQTGTIFHQVATSPGQISARVTDATSGGLPTVDTTRFRVITEAEVGRARYRLGMTLHIPDDALLERIRSIPSALVYWPLDEVNTTTAQEAIAGRHATYSLASIAGAQTHTHGNPSPRFYWYTEHVRAAHHASYELANGTLAFWARFDVKPSTSGYRMYAVNKEVTRTSGMSLGVYLDSTSLVFELANRHGTGTTVTTPTSNIIAGQWHHVTVTWGSDGMELYLDGVRASRNTSARHGMNSLFLVRAANTSDWYFGVRDLPESIYAQSSPQVGSVARVALFSSRLTGSQIQSLSQSNSTIQGMQPVIGSFARIVD